MKNEIVVSTVKEILEIVSEINFEENTKRFRSNFIYRGLQKSSYGLETSIQRNCDSKWGDLEMPMLRNFYKYAIMDNQYLGDSDWEKMIIGQHYGLPTRLLDWSYSPLIGLHFALLEDNPANIDQYDCALWKIDITEINRHLPQKAQESLERNRAFLFSTEMIKELYPSLHDYDMAMAEKSFAIIEPPSIDNRIINQYSYFSVVPKGIEDLEKYLLENTENSVKYIIKKEIKWELREVLDRCNINERIAYPGLEGISKWLKRHYYHSDKM